MESMIRDEVLEDIRQSVNEKLSPQRYIHTIGCMNESLRLAKGKRLDISVLTAAALLHDITKECSAEDHLKLCEKWNIIIPQAAFRSPAVLHQYTGAAVAGGEYCMPVQVCRAISSHTTGSTDMNETDRIIFLADLTEPGRKIANDPHVCMVREMAEKNTLDACIEQIGFEIQRLTQMGKEVYFVTNEAYIALQKMKSGRTDGGIADDERLI